MRPVYMISGGITKFAKAHADKDFRLMVKEAFDYALQDLGGKLAVLVGQRRLFREGTRMNIP